MSKVTDVIGNEFQIGQMVHLTLEGRPVIAQVQQINASDIAVAPYESPTRGTMILVVVVPVDIPKMGPVQGVMVLQQPKEPSLPRA